MRRACRHQGSLLHAVQGTDMADAVTCALTFLMAAGLSAAASAAEVIDPSSRRRATACRSAQAIRNPRFELSPQPVRLQMIARDGSTRLAVVNGHRVRPAMRSRWTARA